MLGPEISNQEADLDWASRLEKSLAGKTAQKKEVRRTGLLSDLFDEKLLTLFEATFANSETGNGTLAAAEFKSMLARYIPLKLVANIYRAIDVNDVGFINYAEFTNYLIALEAGSASNDKTSSTRLALVAQQDETSPVTHRDFVDCMTYVSKPVPLLITGGRDGMLALWNPSNLQLLRTIHHKDRNTVFKEERQRVRDHSHHLLPEDGSIGGAGGGEDSFRHKPKGVTVAITALCAMPASGLLCVGSADACMTIYELGTQEVCGRLSTLEQVPVSIEAFSLRTHMGFLDPDKDAPVVTSSTIKAAQLNVIQFLAIGDVAGTVRILRLHPEFGQSTDVGMKKKNQLMFAYSVKVSFLVFSFIFNCD